MEDYLLPRSCWNRNATDLIWADCDGASRLSHEENRVYFMYPVNVVFSSRRFCTLASDGHLVIKQPCTVVW